MTTDYIHKKAARLLRSCETTDPFRIARELGIHIMWQDFDKLKGMYKVYERNRFIVINNGLDEYEQRVVCAHELGHDALHQEYAKDGGLQDFIIFDMKTRAEFEANVFAADILLPEDEVFEMFKDHYDEAQIAAAFGVNINMLLIKMLEMNKKGYDFNLSSPPRADFLKG